jgi:chromosome segregation ATPase
MCDKRSHKGKACENLKRILPAEMLNKYWPGHENLPSDDQANRLRQELTEAKRAKDKFSRGRGGNRGRAGSTRGGSQVSSQSAPLDKKRRLDDENEDGKDTVSLTGIADKPDYPDSELHLAFKQAQTRKRRAWQQQKNEEARIAGENAPTREEELEQRVSDLKKILKKYQADAVTGSTKNREMEARVFEAESRCETLQETLSTFKRRQKMFNEETNKRMMTSAERTKAVEAEKQQVASKYGTAVLENQSLKTEIASLQAEIVRLNSEIASLRNKDAGRNFTGAWDDDEEVN